ncbi:helix-turn-helix transcriptional regulator [Pimelobacter simplex]|uniref:HTH-type transcriptional regulator RipA n=1 Tax=Nocardioides simplex TaxID=2045 RepID=A0A7J5E3P1_NOCSI|nr:helix-turn-helix transcriptional regulator [Pimelobacter simplex]KAB2812783.1 helix-turn-helix transcriptional regulator [Pimelobacter simplex]
MTHRVPISTSPPPTVTGRTPAALVTKHLVEPHARSIDWHVHRKHELLWGFAGVRTVETEGIAWTLPPTAGLWVPAGVRHAGFAGAGARHYFTLVDPVRFPGQWDRPVLVAMPPVVRELLLHLRDATLSDAERADAERAAMSLVKPVAGTGIALPTPTDPRTRVVSAGLVENPADRRTTEQWAAEVGLSGRTLDRLFAGQTGMTFARWRVQARVRAAILLLADGQTATAVAHQVGYQTASAFVRAFRQTTGTTPGAYVAALRDRPPA